MSTTTASTSRKKIYSISDDLTLKTSLAYDADERRVLKTVHRINQRFDPEDRGAHGSAMKEDAGIRGRDFIRDVEPGFSLDSVTCYIGDKYEGLSHDLENWMYTKYIFAGGRRIAEIDADGVRYFHKDHLGGASIVSDEPAENFPEIAIHTPFGEMWGYGLDDGASPARYKFTDQELDIETGLYDYGARLYDPALGRFISPDSIIPDVYDPQFLNRYTYVLNNPLIYTDPTGHHLGGYNGPQDYHDFDDNNGGRSSWGIDKDTYERNYALRNTSYNRESQNYYFNDPNVGQIEVEPFEDEIPEFDWHRDRNIFNIIPEEMPVQYGHFYIDKYGNFWKKDHWATSGWFHGWKNTTFRGMGPNQGSQATYDEEGNVVDSGGHMGTFDYGPAPSSKQMELDVKPHDPVNNPYTPNLSTLF